MTQPAHRTICTLGLAVSDRETHGSVRDDATDSVSLDVSQHVVERALRYVLEGAGARFVDEPEAITISDSVRDLPNLGDRQKERIVGQAGWYASTAAIAAVEIPGS